MNKKYTKNMLKVIDEAGDISAKFGVRYVGSEQILYGLLKVYNCVASSLLRGFGVSLAEYERYLIKTIQFSSPLVGLTARCKEMLDVTEEVARRAGCTYITTEQVLYAVLCERDCCAVEILYAMNVDVDGLFSETSKTVFPAGSGKKNSSSVSVIEKHDEYDDGFPYGENDFGGAGNDYGERGECFGGKNDVARYGDNGNGGENFYDKNESGGFNGKNGDKQPRNNPQNKKAPDNAVKSLSSYGIDMTERARSGKYDPVIGREKEIERMAQILLRRTKNNPIIVGEPGVGKSAVVEGFAQAIADGKVPDALKDKTIFSLDLSGMLAGTRYRGDFEERLKNAVSEVRQSGNVIIFIDEIHNLIGAGASGDGNFDAADILKPMLARGELTVIGTTTYDEYRKYIEKDSAFERRFSQITLEPPSVDDAIKILSGLKDRYEKHHGVVITADAIKAASELSDRYITDRFLPDKAIDLIDEAASKEKIAASRERRPCRAIGREDIAKVVYDWTKIPVTTLTTDEKQRILQLESILHERVIGQNEAVSAVSRAIRRSRSGLGEKGKPSGSFIFAGPTGVGKTELSKAIAEALFGGENDLIRIDMSEYMEKHSVSKLIGSPPGYVGFDEEGQLTEKVRRKPYSVVLFDEIEKAHEDIFNLLLQVLDEGRLTDSKGRTVNFRNTVIILTSNVGAATQDKKSRLGFVSSDKDDAFGYEEMRENILSGLRKKFKPEFLNRVDDIICFHRLTKEECKKIAEIQINKLKAKLKEKNISLTVSPAAMDAVLAEGYSEEYGARSLKRTVEKELSDKISTALITGELCENSNVTVGYADGQFRFVKSRY
ncbi:MAG: ATP-dependent Clp protease ATP-binding subunit [Candidatus Borkfalkiaceae bacterium]|nr:ATP-dependent Clp protease ATP-binding subunit [Christensenellaceae bacterium]